VTYTVLRYIVNSPFGHILKGISEDEIFTQSFGKNIYYYKTMVFIIGGAFAAIAGNLYAYYVSYIDPSSFNVMESILIVSMVIIGGAGNLLGSILGAVLLIVFPEIMRLLGFPNSIAANLRQMVYGIMLVIFMFYRPQGILGKYSFNRNHA
jgi:branched-chain amino acid transport system permease protein